MWMTSAPLGDNELMMTRTRELFALSALSAWSGTQGDLLALMAAAQVARALACLGYAPDEMQTVERATGALTRCRTMRPGSYGMQPDDLAAVRELVRLIEAQRAVAPAKDYARALLACRR